MTSKRLWKIVLFVSTLICIESTLLSCSYERSLIEVEDTLEDQPVEQSEVVSNFMRICESEDLINGNVNLISALKSITRALSCQETYDRLMILDNLDLKERGIKDISLLAEFTHLKRIDLSGNELSNIDVLKDFHSVSSLNLAKNLIEDLTPLSFAKTVRELNLNHNRNLSDLSGLENLRNIEVLSLAHARIRSLEPIQNLTELKTLDLSHNLIDRIDSLEGLKEILELSISNNLVRDLSSLRDMNLIAKLEVNSNPIDDSLVRNQENCPTDDEAPEILRSFCKRNSCQVESMVKRPEAPSELRSITLNVINSTDNAVRIYSLDSTGTRGDFVEVPATQSIQVATRNNYPYVLTDQTEECISIIAGTDNFDEFYIEN